MKIRNKDIYFLKRSLRMFYNINTVKDAAIASIRGVVGIKYFLFRLANIYG